jgi:hypothetical protein
MCPEIFQKPQNAMRGNQNSKFRKFIHTTQLTKRLKKRKGKIGGLNLSDEKTGLSIKNSNISS